MTKVELIASVAAEAGMSKKDAEKARSTQHWLLSPKS